MKPILTITLICAGLSLKAQPHKYVHTFISNYVLSGAGGSKESHVIEFREGRTEEDCDTLLIDNFKILCLHSGEIGEEIEKSTNKFRYYSNIIGVKNPEHGRIISGPKIPNNLDYDTKIELWHKGGTWDVSKGIEKVIVRIHGMVTAYYK